MGYHATPELRDCTRCAALGTFTFTFSLLPLLLFFRTHNVCLPSAGVAAVLFSFYLQYDSLGSINWLPVHCYDLVHSTLCCLPHPGILLPILWLSTFPVLGAQTFLVYFWKILLRVPPGARRWADFRRGNHQRGQEERKRKEPWKVALCSGRKLDAVLECEMLMVAIRRTTAELNSNMCHPLCDGDGRIL